MSLTEQWQEQEQEQGALASAPCNPVRFALAEERKKRKDLAMGRTIGSKNKKTKKRSERLLVAKTMPPLYHTLPGKEFDAQKSEVYAWISKQEGLMNWLWKQLGSAGYIVYDSATGQWIGVDYER